MDRTNIFAGHDDRTVVGWFDYERAARWSDYEPVSRNGSHGPGAGEAVILTAGGKWLMEHWTNWQGQESTRVYVTPDEARDWLLRNKEDGAVEKHFGELPEEEDRRPGRPEIGGRITTAIGDDLLGAVDAYAQAHGIKRADAVRQLMTAGLAVSA